MEIISEFAVRQKKKTCRSNSSESNKRIYYELFTKEHWELVAGVSPRRNGFGTQSVQVGYVRDEVALEQVLQHSFVGSKYSTT
jgi:hypothetical protein